jgi:hypothetical protein
VNLHWFDVTLGRLSGNQEDELVRREPLEGLEPAAEVVGGNEVVKVLSQLGMISVVIALDRRFLDRPVHSLGLAIRPWMCRLRQPMFDVKIGTCRIEGMATEENPFCPHRLDVRDRPPAAGRISDVRAVIRQNGVDLVWNCVSQIAKEVCRDPACRLAVKLNKRELRRPIDGNEEIEPALGSLHFGDVDMEEADWLDLELLLGGLLTAGIQ